MKYRIMAGFMCAIVLAFGVVAPTSALTVDEIQTQIKALLQQISDLTVQLNALHARQTPTPPPTPPDVIIPAKHRICDVLNRNLILGMQGDDVRNLQEFLNSEGYLTAAATGYYGSMTTQAVAKWQATQGVSPVGSVGPMSRERLKIWCGGGGTTSSILKAEHQRGSAPLSVTFKAHVKLANGQFVADAGDYKIVFGDGTEYTLPCSGTTPWCEGPHVITHTYQTDGSYTAKLVHYGYFAPPPAEQVVGTVVINVGATICAEEYKPVCGLKQIVCITTPCNPVPTTYSNRCLMNADNATFAYEGQCRANTTTNPADDPKCQAWHDGCNTCSRQLPGGPAMCTMMACRIDNTTPAYCKAWFNGTTGNKPPVISSFSGPTTLGVSQQGTWTIQASDLENDVLSYRITWGDEVRAMSAMSGATAASEAFTQTTTFTHAYASAGTYTVIIVVRDSSGQEAKSSSTVKVGSDTPVACTLQYDPVCGHPSGCMNTCPAGMYCAMLCRPYPAQTYSNGCFLKAVGAELIHEGICTSTDY